MNRLTTAERVAVVKALVEGNSIRSTPRMTDVSKPTILKLLVDLGRVAMAYQDMYVLDIKARRIQCDEIWSFIGAKAKNASQRKQAEERKNRGATA
jgi:hypothetical protein